MVRGLILQHFYVSFKNEEQQLHKVTTCNYSWVLFTVITSLEPKMDLTIGPSAYTNHSDVMWLVAIL
jgi:hypothetical protein